MAQTDIRIFSIKESATADEDIRDWMRKYPEGYYLTHTRSKDATMLHRVDCAHAGGPEVTTSLARNEKICSPHRQDLIDETKRRFGKQPRFCSDCKP